MRRLKSTSTQVLIACFSILVVLIVNLNVSKTVHPSHETTLTTEHRTSLIGTSDGLVDSLRALYQSNPAQNDPTGLKRITRSDQSFIPKRFALNYRLKHFKVDHERHYIVNFDNNGIEKIKT